MKKSFLSLTALLFLSLRPIMWGVVTDVPGIKIASSAYSDGYKK